MARDIVTSTSALIFIWYSFNICINGHQLIIKLLILPHENNGFHTYQFFESFHGPASVDGRCFDITHTYNLISSISCKDLNGAVFEDLM